MQEYQEFVRKSIENYQKLPQETNDLYKRHYINIPFDLKSFHDNSDSAAKANGLSEKDIAKLGIRFDVVIGSSNFVSNTELARIGKTESMGNLSANGMHTGDDDKFASYISAFPGSTMTIEVPDGKTASINALIINSDKPLNSRVFIKLGKKSKLNMFEYYCSTSSTMTALGTLHEITLDEEAEIELNALHNENDKTISLSHCTNIMGERSHLKYNAFYNGSPYTRVRNVIEANSNYSKVDVSELMFGSKEQKFDILTKIVNAAPHTNASLESKAALLDHSFCIMKGYAKINRGATKARSYVHERGILLDKNAKVEGLPDMSVDENDVKATHSSATAPVDPESVFYLMSKGISEIGVKKLLVTGFFAENLSKIQNKVMAELSMSLINAKLEDRSFGSDPKMDTRNMWVSPSASSESDMFKGHYKYRGE